MSYANGCRTCAPGKPTYATKSAPSTLNKPTVTTTSPSPPTCKDSSPPCTTGPTPPPSKTANACCAWSSKTSSSAPSTSPSDTASPSSTTRPAAVLTRPTPLIPTVTIRRVIHCVGGVLSPLLANIALSALDEHFAAKWEALGPDWTRAKHRRGGGPVMKLVRYADDFVVMVGGRREHADALWDEVAAGLAPMGLRPSVQKTRICHIDGGFGFLGRRSHRH